MEIKILAFGQISEIFGKSELVTSGQKNTEELIYELIKKFPELKNTKFSIALNNKIVNEKTNLKENDVVALLPPFSGG